MAYTAIDDPEAYFQVVTWTGNATDDRTITLPGDTDMQPDLVWAKERSSTSGHIIVDAVRGATNFIQSHNTTAEDTNADIMQSFETDGFEIGTHGAINEDTETYVAWCWKAGTAFSNDASATSIGSIDSSGSVSTDAGFSICSYTGNGIAGATIKHGLSTVPEMIIVKGRTANPDNWRSYHKSLTDPTEDYLKLNTTDAETDGAATTWNSTGPTSSVFSVATDNSNNADTKTYIAYCFDSVQGYSKFGSYTGNGNADGTFVYTGFRPAMLITKRTDSASDWRIWDNKRDTFNLVDEILYPSASNGAGTETFGDFLSNGFKIRTSGVDYNGSGNSYIYMAFAEAPFVNSNGVPCNAR